MKKTKSEWMSIAHRQRFVFITMASVFFVLALRVVHLQTKELERLQEEGNKHHIREVQIISARGEILDRNGQILSVSTPVDSLAADPKDFCKNPAKWGNLAAQINVTTQNLQEKCELYKNHDFMYIRRRLPPKLVENVLNFKIPGLSMEREYKRYFPGGPVGAHLLGLTNIDNHGQEGLELQYDEILRGKNGRMIVLKDRIGHYVEVLDSIQPVTHGTDLQISIDQRVQSLASRHLQTAITKHKAAGGSIIVLSIPSGEILAMVNFPHFNPNDRNTLSRDSMRNRSVTDVLEPGSTIKPFTVAMALETGKVDVQTTIDTSPGYLYLDGATIHDVHDYGELSVFDIIVRSSNIGSAKLALMFPFDDLFNTFKNVGFGQTTGSLPGEASGILKHRSRIIEHATLSYGYGFSVTPLQLARAYTVFATDGNLLPVTLEKKPPGYQAQGVRVFKPETTAIIQQMLEKAASSDGTAKKARIPRYRVGGKTGTTRKLVNGHYVSRYISLFAGLGPLSAPKFVTVVTIDDPRGKSYYGGEVAAPVFSQLMQDLMRLYNIKPDDIDQTWVSSASATRFLDSWLHAG